MEWDLFKKGVFLVNLLAIIYNPSTRQILIGKRVNDPHLKELSWVFPGGRPDYKSDLEVSLKNEVKENTGLDVSVKNIVFAKTYPEKREFLSIYYYCELENAGAVASAQGNLKELKWISPTEVTEYFTTSIHDKILEYLKSLS